MSCEEKGVPSSNFTRGLMSPKALSFSLATWLSPAMFPSAQAHNSTVEVFSLESRGTRYGAVSIVVKVCCCDPEAKFVMHHTAFKIACSFTPGCPALARMGISSLASPRLAHRSIIAGESRARQFRSSSTSWGLVSPLASESKAFEAPARSASTCSFASCFSSSPATPLACSAFRRFATVRRFRVLRRSSAALENRISRA
mmetsp:Transcript_15938/g.28375  ORF Transcript_15938/g.28375 Transcript_15938/m.28375 type:complete len:200 (+) Transcript_15938:1531-2130(+)